MRGAPGLSAIHSVTVGIIPADAGSTTLKRLIQALVGDHPRGCGEHWSARPAGIRSRGSSLRMREARTDGVGVATGSGIIPADAGSTRIQVFREKRNVDHPRGCGEHTTS